MMVTFGLCNNDATSGCRTIRARYPWRQLRLAAAHASLVEGSNGTSITEVAARFGFGHFGRFAQDYRQRFGETPSETLRRSHIERREWENRRRNHAPATPPSSTRDR